MSSFVLAMRAANPEHLIHYVINPATMAKWMVESAQQNYYPPKGISGNHLATEILGSIFGKHPAGRYWTNTTYKLWGPEYMAMLDKYGRGAKGQAHHITQAGYTAINIFADGGEGGRAQPDSRAADGTARQRNSVEVRRVHGPAMAVDQPGAHRQQLEQGERPGPGVHVQVRERQHGRQPGRVSRTASRPTGTSSSSTPTSDCSSDCSLWT